MTKHLPILAFLAFALFSSVAGAQIQRPELPVPAPEEPCDDPLLWALRLLPADTLVKEFEKDGAEAYVHVEVWFRSLDETDCDNWVATFEVLWTIVFKDVRGGDDVTIQNSGSLIVEKSDGAYSTLFTTGNEVEGEAAFWFLNLDYAASYEATAAVPFSVTVEDGETSVAPEGLILDIALEVSGTATESIDDRYVSLEGHFAASADLHIEFVPMGDGMFSYDGDLCYAWAADLAGYVQYGRYKRNVNWSDSNEDCVPFEGEADLDEIIAQLQALAAKAEDLLAAIE